MFVNLAVDFRNHRTIKYQTILVIACLAKECGETQSQQNRNEEFSKRSI